MPPFCFHQELGRHCRYSWRRV